MAKQTKADNATPVTNPVDNDGFLLTDGGEIMPGWAPQLHEKHDDCTAKERAERIENGKIASMADHVTGNLIQSTAWNRPCYALENAVDSDGNKYPILRLPDATVLFNAFANKDLGAEIRVKYRGKVKADEGKVMLFDVLVKDMKANLPARRENALRLQSKADKEHEERMTELREQLDIVRRETEVKNAQIQLKQLSVSAGKSADVVDAEFEADEFAREANRVFGKPGNG